MVGTHVFPALFIRANVVARLLCVVENAAFPSCDPASASILSPVTRPADSTSLRRPSPLWEINYYPPKNVRTPIDRWSP